MKQRYYRFGILTCLLLFLLTGNIVAQTNEENQQTYTKLMKQKNYGDAIRLMDKVLKDKESKTAENYYKRAAAYAAIESYVGAVADCTSSLMLDDTNTEVYFLRGKCKYLFGDVTYQDDLLKGGEQGQKYLAKLGAKKPKAEPQQNYYAQQTPSPKQDMTDVDQNIPMVAANSNKHTFVVIVANEKYMENNISAVNYAENDGRIFRQYCIRTLGIPEENIHMKLNATRNQMRAEMKWAQNVSKAFGQKANIIFYYSGHGMPDEVSRKAYLLPADGMANDPESAYPLSTFYEQLAGLQANAVMVFLDACFSGAQRNGGMLTSTKGVSIKPKTEQVSGNVAVLSATKEDQTAYPYNEKRHGLFTYFLLKKLHDTKGNVTLGELKDYVESNVYQTSTVKYKTQTPTLTISAANEQSLLNMKLR